MTTYVAHVDTYVTDVNRCCNSEEGAFSPSWPNGININIIVIAEVQVSPQHGPGS
jgi:hypothetical protein